MSTRRNKQVISEGPWPGGLNRRQATTMSSLMPNGQFAWCKNLDPQRDGSLLSRRGWRYVLNNAGNLYAAPLVRFDLLGQYYNPNGNIHALVGKVTSAGNTQLWHASAPDVAGNFSLCGVPSVGRELIGVIYYNSKWWFVPRSVTGGYWTADIFSATVPTVVASMPYGDKTFIWKDRLWIVNYTTNTIYWSKATDPSVWSVPDGGYFKLSGDASRPITDCFVSGDTLYIFKRNSWFQFNFSTDPANDGYLRLMGTEMGAYAACQYLDENYLVNFKGVFKFVGGNFISLSDSLSLDFNAVETYPLALSVVNNMLILQPKSGMIEPLWDAYAMNLDTGAWTMYDFGGSNTTGIGAYTKCLYTFDGNNRRALFGDGKAWLNYAIDRAWLGGYTQSTIDLYKNNLHYYQPEYSFIGKAHDFGTPDSWKKCYKVEFLGVDNLLDADGDITWKVKTAEEDVSQESPTDILGTTTHLKTVTNSNTGLRKVVLYAKAFRFKLLGFWFAKPGTDLGAADPGFGTYFRVMQLNAVIDTRSNDVNANV